MKTTVAIMGLLIPVLFCIAVGWVIALLVPVLPWWEYAIFTYVLLALIQMAKKVG